MQRLQAYHLPVRRAYIVDMSSQLLGHFLDTIEDLLQESPGFNFTNPFEFYTMSGDYVDIHGLSRLDYFNYMLIGYFEKTYQLRYCRRPLQFAPRELYASIDICEFDNHIINFIHYPIPPDFGPYFDLCLVDGRTIEIKEVNCYDSASVYQPFGSNPYQVRDIRANHSAFG